ncbi:uncharacterized protein UV8b_06194 [Ustilaginoidea virens]|uniref:Uncharacterized protein n=1 Tax=Ustilaginoidea virens TaxID=1159556 RepID=A0A8E5HV94_USTVR|nr:uncharacterized protein UV8b_06194 [Ustilaginoidea virens]QUC21953.1 hypothetical protein UV8b_06194 [Ustilaginoidea virens]
MDFFRQPLEQPPSTPPAETGIPGSPSPQFALLNYFFPGYSMVTSTVNAYMGADINSYMPILLAMVAVSVSWNYIKDRIWIFLNDYWISSVTIRADDEIYDMVMFWLSRQKFAHNSRHFVANVSISSRSRSLLGYPDSDGEDDEEVDDHINAITGESNNNKQALHYTPSFGTHVFWYKRRPLTLERVQNRDVHTGRTVCEKEELRMSCLGRSPRILKELLLEARQMNMKKDDRKTVIYRANLAEVYWQRCMSRLNRPFSTVILSEEIKQDLIDDAADYLNPVTRRWYANRGIPYRRGYLLYGPPGTGKSSLSLALAGHFRMKIYIMSLSSSAATEENLTSLFHELPTRCVVLLEDIDSAGLTHTRDDPPAPPAAPEPPPPPAGSKETNGTRASPAGRVSLSGLLNILDGVASQEGRILIMTTNHMEQLDKALIRPGRIDMVIPFGLADSSMTASIFRAIYTPYDNEAASKEDASKPDAEAVEARLAKKRAQISQRVDELAKVFSDKMPDLEFSPAEIQGLLLRHKLDPDGAVASVEAWVSQMRQERKERAAEEEEKRRKEKEEEGKKKKQDEDNEKNKQAEERASRKHKAEEGDNEENWKGEPKRKGSAGDASCRGPKTGKPKKSASDSGYETS